MHVLAVILMTHEEAPGRVSYTEPWALLNLLGESGSIIVIVFGFVGFLVLFLFVFFCLQACNGFF